MKSFILQCGACLLGALTAVSLQAAEKTTPADKTNRLIVKYAIPVDPVKSVNDPLIAQAAGGRILSIRIASSGANVVDLGLHKSVDEMRALADEVEKQPGVLYAEPDLIMVHQEVPNDDRYNEQWHYFEPAGGINLPEAWDMVTTVNPVVVAVIDTGVRPHADLVENMLPGYDFIADIDTAQDNNGRDKNVNDPGDYSPVGSCGTNGRGRPVPLHEESSSWHGTHVAGTIAAVNNNGRGVSGIGKSTRILPVRVLGRCGGYTSDITDGMRWAAGLPVPGVPNNVNPAKVLNLSLGGPGHCSRTYQDTINDILDAGATIVVAAGNDNRNARNFSPASCDGVITVAANKRDGGRAYYSNYGNAVDITAPGGETMHSGNGILSTIDSGAREPESDDYDWYQGTSMAASHVTGVAGLMYSVNPALKPAEVKNILMDTARPFPRVSRRQCNSDICGTGILDAKAAVMAVSSTPAPDVDHGIIKKGVAVTDLSTTDEGQQLFFRLEVPPGASDLNRSITGGTGDADLYVHRSRRPTIEKYDYAPYQSGNEESVDVSSPAAGTWYIMLDAYKPFTGLTLEADYELKTAVLIGQKSFSSTPMDIPDNRSRGVTSSIVSYYQGDAGTLNQWSISFK
ncbi:S8 family serine peptidase [Sansalvadorimonas sp. 2012CJ34-2]|uniref:S8 family serine peptidase n=1 Tax=Parendozoicomonas callyspongiae TaxID=2942213 RepID=A0ABT0PHX1_9GAMM|nr:S8 family peptidase [Sansalvadorimonas sp. 2012CJ34-2]MCL6270940.1 S8 family serine peptidase [Sansalvadorimonas sp. 2012CJ34-2]